MCDRDTRFISDFCTEVNDRLQTKLLMSMVFHPQTQGLPEISNKQVLRYLQAFATRHPEQRHTMPALEAGAYDTSTQLSTNRSTSELDQVYTPSNPLHFVASQPQLDQMRSLG